MKGGDRGRGVPYLEQDSCNLPLCEIGHSSNLSPIYNSRREVPEQTSHGIYPFRCTSANRAERSCANNRALSASSLSWRVGIVGMCVSM